VDSGRRQAFPAVVDAGVFAQVQELILARARRFTDEEMLESLKSLWSRQEECPACSSTRRKQCHPAPPSGTDSEA